MSIFLWLKYTRFDFGWGSAPDPAGGAHSVPPDSLTGFEGVLLLREGRECGGKEGKEREKERGKREKERGKVASWLLILVPSFIQLLSCCYVVFHNFKPDNNKHLNTVPTIDRTKCKYTKDQKLAERCCVGAG